MRPGERPRRYIARPWLLIVRPLLRYSPSRDAYVLRAVGNSRGPVLRPERRRLWKHRFDGVERRGTQEHVPLLR